MGVALQGYYIVNMQQIYRKTFMCFSMDVLLYICCIFSGYLFLRTPLEGCFCRLVHFKLSHHCSKLFFLFKSLDDFTLVIEKTNIPFHGTNDCFILPDGCSSILGFLNFIAAISFKFVVSTFSLSSNDLSNYSLI